MKNILKVVFAVVVLSLIVLGYFYALMLCPPKFIEDVYYSWNHVIPIFYIVGFGCGSVFTCIIINLILNQSKVEEE